MFEAQYTSQFCFIFIIRDISHRVNNFLAAYIEFLGWKSYTEREKKSKLKSRR